MPRKYELRARAESQQETRQRIVEATVHLHTTIGPARTTVTKIAEAAGVERLTVYRHFPELGSLFQACSAHWGALNPSPEPDAWLSTADPVARLRRGLGETYSYYRRHHEVLGVVLRDRDAGMPVGGRLIDYAAAAAGALALAWPETAEVRAAIGHAVDFDAWRSLAVKQGLDDAQAVELMTAMVRAAAAG